MDKETVVHIHCDILFKIGCPVMCENMDGTTNHYGK